MLIMSRRRVLLKIKAQMKTNDLSVDKIWNLCSTSDRIELFNHGLSNLNKIILVRINKNIEMYINDKNPRVEEKFDYHKFWSKKDLVQLLYQFLNINEVWKLSCLNDAINDLVQEAKYNDIIDNNQINAFIDDIDITNDVLYKIKYLKIQKFTDDIIIFLNRLEHLEGIDFHYNGLQTIDIIKKLIEKLPIITKITLSTSAVNIDTKENIIDFWNQ